MPIAVTYNPTGEERRIGNIAGMFNNNPNYGKRLEICKELKSLLPQLGYPVIDVVTHRRDPRVIILISRENADNSEFLKGLINAISSQKESSGSAPVKYRDAVLAIHGYPAHK